jgi:hypothetical protein
VTEDACVIGVKMKTVPKAVPLGVATVDVIGPLMDTVLVYGKIKVVKPVAKGVEKDTVGDNGELLKVVLIDEETAGKMTSTKPSEVPLGARTVVVIGAVIEYDPSSVRVKVL